MKVLLVHNRYQRPGGEDQVFESEAALLAGAGAQVLRYEAHNDAVRSMRRLTLALRTLWSVGDCRRVRALLRAERPDVLHCHNTFPLLSPSVYWAAARERVPVVQTLHNYRCTCLNAFLYRDGAVCERCLGRFPWAGLRRACYRGSWSASLVAAFAWWVHWRVLRSERQVARFIALTEFGRLKMIEAGLAAERLEVKPNPLSAEFAGRRPSGGADGDPPPRSPGALYVGRLSDEKGVRVLLEAWTLAVDRMPHDATLTLVGEGPDGPLLERLASATRNVSLVGWCAREDVLRRVQSAGLLVLPSLCYETFGIAVAEAFACGCPAMVASHGALTSLVEEGRNGFLVAPGDVRAWANRLVEGLGDGVRLARLGRQARLDIEAGDCMPERNAQRLLAIYHRAIAAKRGACGRAGAAPASLTNGRL